MNSKLISDYIMKFVLVSFAAVYVIICLCAFIPFLQGMSQLIILTIVSEVILAVITIFFYNKNKC